MNLFASSAVIKIFQQGNMFITFEGIEGSGKTTQIKRLHKVLKNRKIPCLVTREPGATKIGLQIRAILLDRKNKKMDPLAELFLYLADRCQHMKEKIGPALSEGPMGYFRSFLGCHRGLSRAGQGFEYKTPQTITAHDPGFRLAGQNLFAGLTG